ncbi:MAG: hypothetical protein VCC00_15240 [Deltaproteobacteria bacterium]
MSSDLNRMGRWLSRLFRYEAIGRGGVTYLDRWVVAHFRDRRLYLHHFRLDDPEEPHNHPRVFVSFLFRGSYHEDVLAEDGSMESFHFRAPYLRRFSPRHAHRLSQCTDAWSLVAVGRRRQDWGFRSSGRWVSAEEIEARRGVVGGPIQR